MSCKSYVEISNICKDRLPVFSMHLLKQLNVECNVNFSCLAVLQINNDLKALACRATWRVKETHVQEARNLIASKRLSLDDSISQVCGVQFFLSSITATSTNAKKTRQGADENGTSDQVYPAVAYFVVYRETDTCNAQSIYTLLHNQDTEANVQPITTRASTSMESVARQLFQVVKDHKNPMVLEMVQASNQFCVANCRSSSAKEESNVPEHVTDRRPRYPTSPCRIIVINTTEFDSPLHDAVDKLRSDGLTVEIDSWVTAQPDGPCLSSNNNDLIETVKKIAALMSVCGYALHQGDVYAKAPGATMAYVQMMDVGSYLNKLLVNEYIRGSVLKHFTSLLRILSHPVCEMIVQIQFDLDLIEVSNGFFLQISRRQFIRDAIPPAKCSLISPRAFVPYNCSTMPQPGYFKQGVLNSFPDEIVRARFCNKFYQCLLAGKMPHKIRKLVVAGPKDSGKTSWACIFHRIVPKNKIASITGEGQFSAAMIKPDTQLVIIDEWSSRTLQSDLAKTILQGGWMVTAVKHGLPRTVMNNSPFYITSNEVLDFGDDDENVKRRIAIFRTKSLPHYTSGADRWMFDHAMDCISWLANEITRLRHHIPAEELWYETQHGSGIIENESNALRLFDVDVVARVTMDELKGKSKDQSDVVESTDAIHESFHLEATRHRLSRKRQAHKVGCTISRAASQSDEIHDESEQEIDQDMMHLSEVVEPPVFEHIERQLEAEKRVSTEDSTHSSTTSTQPIGHGLVIRQRRTTRRTRPEQVSSVGNVTHTCDARHDTEQEDATTSKIVEQHHTNVPPTKPGHCTTTPSTFGPVESRGWVLNDRSYFRQIVKLWKRRFDVPELPRVHAGSFNRRMERAKRRLLKWEKDF